MERGRVYSIRIDYEKVKEILGLYEDATGDFNGQGVILKVLKRGLDLAIEEMKRKKEHPN